MYVVQKLENILHNLFILHRSPFTVHYLQSAICWNGELLRMIQCAMFINYFSSFFLNVDAIFHIVCGRIFAFVFVRTENKGKRSEYVL